MYSMSLFIKTLTTSYLMSTSSGTMIVFFFINKKYIFAKLCHVAVCMCTV